jgi:two-component system, chemotaxis family, sensor kinase CheA
VHQGLKNETNFKVFTGNDDIIALKYNPVPESNTIGSHQFIIFSKFSEAQDLNNALINILLLIGSTGVVLSLILTMIFTYKMRKNIKNLSKATEVISDGDLTQKIEVRSKDELGQLGTAFNTMLDVLARNEQQKSEYSEFITLINQNATLSEISDAALRKIVNVCGYIVGVLYLVEDHGYKRISSFGLDSKYESNSSPGLFRTVVDKQEPLEINSEESFSTLKSGLASISLRYLLIIPVIYNNKVIALIELGSVSSLRILQENIYREYRSSLQ